MDEFFSDKPSKINIVKMDIEGLEFEALKGMTGLLDANKSMKFFLEFNPYTATCRGTDLDSFIDYLFDICLQVFHIDEVNKTKKPVSKEWLKDFAKNKKEGHFTNLIGIRGFSSTTVS